VAAAMAFRIACYGLMVWMMLWSERRSAPTLPDALLSLIPYQPWVDQANYSIWLLAYVPVSVTFFFADIKRFTRYLVTAGLLALVRGVCIMSTGLGPVNGHDVNAGQDLLTWSHFWQIADPVKFFSGSARIYLTKDLFFSGHTATTFLLLLYVWRYRRMRAAMILAHVVVVASVFASHLHYTIDVLGAYFATISVFVLREGQLGAAVPRELRDPAAPMKS
jgi:hypothetical protein